MNMCNMTCQALFSCKIGITRIAFECSISSMNRADMPIQFPSLYKASTANVTNKLFFALMNSFDMFLQCSIKCKGGFTNVTYEWSLSFMN